MSFARSDGRGKDELREVILTPGYLPHAEGSALIEMGQTRVICVASVEERVPPFLRGKGQGWVTAEYAMLPRATVQRTARATGRGGPSGRTHEIQRLIGRSIRAVVDMSMMGERTIMIDCDVLQADGGTRTASITGAYVAFALACRHLMTAGKISQLPIKTEVAAISVGILNRTPLLDLNYEEDSQADVDMNIICAGDGRFIEVQGTAEKEPFARDEMDNLLELAKLGIEKLVAIQRGVLANPG
jgi:ribonuclease PH